MITEIMHKDNEFDDLSNHDRKKQRQLVLKENVDAYFELVKLKYTQVTQNSAIGKALAYSINQENCLRSFLNDGKVPMDNNYAEQAIRPFTIARKNFVLMESSSGAKASAILFSLAETAKANGINTYQFFKLLLTEIPKHMSDKNLSFLDNLLPWAKKSKRPVLAYSKKIKIIFSMFKSMKTPVILVFSFILVLLMDEGLQHKIYYNDWHQSCYYKPKKPFIFFIKLTINLPFK